MEYDIIARFFRQIANQRKHFESQVQVFKSLLIRNGITKQARILDAACGTGDVLTKLFHQGYQQIYGLDGSKAMLAQFKKAEQDIRVEHCFWKDLGLFFKRLGQFDVIYILGHSLPHAPIQDIPQLLKDIYGSLNCNGLFIFDMRLWTKDNDNRLIQPNREEGLYRFHGKITMDDGCYWVEDKVSYHNSQQTIDYRIRKIKGAGLGYDSEITCSLTYSIFDHSQMQKWLLGVGFSERKIEIQQYSEWPYIIFVCRR